MRNVVSVVLIGWGAVAQVSVFDATVIAFLVLVGMVAAYKLG